MFNKSKGVKETMEKLLASLIAPEQAEIFMPSDFEILKQALKRNERMKPVKFKNTFGLCPICNQDLGQTEFCSNCGQKLDWGNKNGK